MARSNRRQFVWARTHGVAASGGPDSGPSPAVDLMQPVRERFGAGVVRGATVMGIKGWIRPNAAGATFNGQLHCRAAIRVAVQSELDDSGVVEAELSPFGSPESDWMAFQQVQIFSGATEAQLGIATDNVRGNQYALETRAARKFSELGETLGLFVADRLETGLPLPESPVFWDYDLSVGLKLP